MNEESSKRTKHPALEKPPVPARPGLTNQHKPSTTSTSSDFIKVASIPTDSQSSSLNGLAQPTRQITPLQDKPQHLLQPPNYQHHPAKIPPRPPSYQPPPSYQQPVPIVAIGNPGSGKSTILNALAGKWLFGSGISLGCGLTNKFESKEANGRKFIDTPGLADDTYQKAAGDALKKVFHHGGKMKIIFFITQESGRIVSQDVTTMKLVLESVPEIGRNYGVIVNKIPGNVLSHLTDGENLQRLMLSLYAGIKDEFKHDYVLLLPLNSKLNNIDNAILHPSEIHQDLVKFINTNIPDAYITPGKITEIRVDEFEQLNKKVESLQSELKRNQEMQTAETERLLTELENIEKEKEKEHEEILRKTREELEETKEEMRGLEQTSETEQIKQDMKQMEEVMNQKMTIQQNKIKEVEKKLEHKRKKKKSRRHKDLNLLDYIPTLTEQVENLQSQLKKSQEMQTAETEKLQTELENIEK